MKKNYPTVFRTVCCFATAASTACLLACFYQFHFFALFISFNFFLPPLFYSNWILYLILSFIHSFNFEATCMHVCVVYPRIKNGVI